MMTLLKTVPVASFVVLLLIWWGSSFLAVAVCFVVVLPNIYINTLEGLKNADKQLLQMAQVFRISKKNKFFYIYRSALAPFLYGSMKVSLGMCWKSGVAADRNSRLFYRGKAVSFQGMSRYGGSVCLDGSYYSSEHFFRKMYLVSGSLLFPVAAPLQQTGNLWAPQTDDS